MIRKPFFSIIIPTYNRKNFLEIAIQSVLAQTFDSFELIIVDDGSTDGTKDMVQENFTDERIKYIFQENAERSAARNNGIKKASGTWICFLDSDDQYKKNHLEKLNNFIHGMDNQTGLIITEGVKLVKDKEHLIEFNFHKQDPQSYFLEYPLGTIFVCVHRSILKKFQFDERFRIWEDMHLWLRIMDQYPLFLNRSKTIVHVPHADSTVSSLVNKLNKEEINQHLQAISELKGQLREVSSGKLHKTILSKLDMYLYQSRINGQMKIGLWLWSKRYFKEGQFSLRALTDLVKVLICVFFKPQINSEV